MAEKQLAIFIGKGHDHSETVMMPGIYNATLPWNLVEGVNQDLADKWNLIAVYGFRPGDEVYLPTWSDRALDLAKASGQFAKPSAKEQFDELTNKGKNTWEIWEELNVKKLILAPDAPAKEANSKKKGGSNDSEGPAAADPDNQGTVVPIADTTK